MVFGDPERPADPRAFLEEWKKREAGEQQGDPRGRIRDRARLLQDARRTYTLLLEEYPETVHAEIIRQRLARIDGHGGH